MVPQIDQIMCRIAQMQVLARQRADRVKHHEMSAKAAKAANLRDQVELRAMLEDLARGACATGEIALQSIPHSVDDPTSTSRRVLIEQMQRGLGLPVTFEQTDLPSS